MSDLCGRGWEDTQQDSSHCLARGEWQQVGVVGEVWRWPGSGPLQVGGAAHSPHTPQQHRWQESPTEQHLQGCISHLTINTQVVDLGEPPFSHASSGGCEVQEEACVEEQGAGAVCGTRGRCINGVTKPICECDPGWFGSRCNTATVPVRLGVSSYMKLALSFTPPPTLLTVQVRLRTRGQPNGLLLHLAAHHREAAFSIHLREGVACVSVSGAGGVVTHTVCVEGHTLGDGLWHTIRAERHGHSLVVEVDDGDDWRHNDSLIWWMSTSPQPLHLDKHDGVTVGGLPHFDGVSLVNVHHDLHDTCLDDLRVSGRPLPLSPGVNRTNWGQATASEKFESGCPPPNPNPDPCENTTCSHPLTCHRDWDQTTCSCGPGGELVGRRCEDVDECVWEPCLHGATCHNTRPGYLCVCSPRHLGDNCQWNRLPHDTHPLAAPAVVALLTVSVLVLVMLGVVLSLRLHRLRVMRLQQTMQVGEKGSNENLKGGGGGGGEGGGGRGGERQKKKGCLSSDDTNSQDTLLQLLKLKLTRDRQQQQQPGRVKKDKDQHSTSEGIDGVGIGVVGVGVGGVSAVVVEVRPPPPPLHHHPTIDQPPPPPPMVLLPGEDLRAYAYEGDGSSSGSLTSTISGLRAEVEREEGGLRCSI
ncbi:hypothetical protein Pmani_029581 [Petrolisthes manimaculis]|uniref:Neural-cadherin n=1 Tax=Petrolisthes manimaculis TaxID=1843537 RepID=A0AAE1NZ85_9EUCA|nr:hypothetical protein Pmani_029581 [Petrolisthes manimaculis]